jgi:glutaredoxin
MRAVARLAGCWLLVLAPATQNRAEGLTCWLDENGRRACGDRPPAGAVVEKRQLRYNLIQPPPADLAAPEPARARPRQPSVTLYSASWCGVCDRARKHMQQRGVVFVEYDIETSERGRRDYARLDAHGVPVILIGRQRMNGFAPDRFDALYGSDP